MSENCLNIVVHLALDSSEMVNFYILSAYTRIISLVD